MDRQGVIDSLREHEAELREYIASLFDGAVGVVGRDALKPHVARWVAAGMLYAF